MLTINQNAQQLLDRMPNPPDLKDPFTYYNYRSARYMIASERGNWLYITQWSSGTTVWRDPASPDDDPITEVVSASQFHPPPA